MLGSFDAELKVSSVGQFIGISAEERSFENGPACAREAAGDPAGIRRLRECDIPDLCDMYAATFRAGRNLRRQELALCFEQTYLSSPADRERPASLVDIGRDGRVMGFMGIITLTARMGEKRVRGGMLGNFMAYEPGRAKSALRLARATTQHDLDFMFTDTANQISFGIARAMRFQTLPLQSLEWVKILRPFQAASFLLGRRLRGIQSLGPILDRVARGADILGKRIPFATVLNQARDDVTDVAIDASTFADRAPALVSRFHVRPDWAREELIWLLDQAGQKTRNGPLHLRAVVDGAGTTLGLYLLYAREGGVAQALQVMAMRNRDDVVMTAVIRRAQALGAVAVRGAACPRTVDGLMRHPGVFYHHVMTATVFARDLELAEALESRDVFIGGLLGEGWTRLVADEFG